MRVVLGLLAAAAVSVLGGHAAHGTPPVARQTAACQPLRPGAHTLLMTSDGLPRVALLHVPPAARSGRPLPLVVAFSGAHGTGPGFERESGLSRQADRSGFLVAYPTAWGDQPFWNMSGHVRGEPDDVAFTRVLLDTVEAATCVDAGRVYATGVSNGGGMAARVGCELADRLAAIAPVAGGYSSLPLCRPVRALAVLEIHSTGDHVVPYEGKPPDGAGNVRAYLAMWRRKDRCTGRARRWTFKGTQRMAWRQCTDGTAVEHVRLTGIRHGWPGPGVPEAPISAAGVVWRFFAVHRHS